MFSQYGQIPFSACRPCVWEFQREYAMADQRSSVAKTSECPASPWKLSLTIFVVSVVGLLLEMMLIRWIGTEVRIFAYLQNTVLIVCFLGLGMGCFTCKQPVNMTRGLFALMLI